MEGAIVPIISVIVSGIVGVAGVVLNVVRRTDSESLERATRRTSALQMLSEEELALAKVREEVRSFKTLIEANRRALGDSYEGLDAAAQRTTREATEFLSAVRSKREALQPVIQDMDSSEIEAVIAQAYHGKMLAEAQLYRTMKSKSDILGIYLGASTGSEIK